MKYIVRVDRTVVDIAYIAVTAEHEDDACQQAESMAERSPSKYDWELDAESFEASEAEEQPADDEDDDE